MGQLYIVTEYHTWMDEDGEEWQAPETYHYHLDADKVHAAVAAGRGEPIHYAWRIIEALSPGCNGVMSTSPKACFEDTRWEYQALQADSTEGEVIGTLEVDVEH